MNRGLKALAAMVLCLMVHGVSVAADRGGHSLDEVKQNLAAGKAVLVDVREVDEWNDGHLQQAKLLPLSRIERGISPEQLTTLAPSGKIIYLHCAAGARCQTAAKLLRSTGRDLRPLKQGYDELLDAGFPRAGR